MKTLRQLANIGAKAAALLNKGCGTLAVTRNHPGWFHDEEQRQAFAQAVKEAVLAELVTKPDSSPTFEAHGFTWTRHKPGEPMPCNGETTVNWLTRHEEAGEPYKHRAEKASNLAWGVPVGWRYAEPTPSKRKLSDPPEGQSWHRSLPPIHLTMDDIRATDEFRHKASHIVETAKHWNCEEVTLSWSDSPTYEVLSTNYLRRQHGSTEWKPCTKEVTV
jgi:hypothetical protein